MTQARLALGQVDQAQAFIGDLEKYHPGFLKTKLLKIQASFANGESENALRQANELLELADYTLNFLTIKHFFDWQNFVKIIRGCIRKDGRRFARLN